MGGMCPKEQNTKNYDRIDKQDSQRTPSYNEISLKKSKQSKQPEDDLPPKNMDKSDNLIGDQMDLSDQDLKQLRIESLNGKKITMNNNVTLKQFESIRLLGRGSLGKVELVQNIKTNKYYAMKVIDKKSLNKETIDMISQEKNLLQQLESSFIVTLHFAFQNQKKIFMILDFMIGGELLVHLRRQFKFTKEQTLFYCSELILGIEYLHQNKIIYKDLKPENILLDEQGHIKITDFGLSSSKKSFDYLGTPEYIAPEIYEGKSYSFEADWYSLGALMFEMLTGKPPYQGQENAQSSSIKRELEIPIFFNEDMTDIVKKLLEKNPKKRLGYKGADEIKTHKFFADQDWQAIAQKQITPPFQPKYDSSLDLKNFDPKFIEQELKQSEESQQF